MVPENGEVDLHDSIILGSDSTNVSSPSPFHGCLQGLVVNSLAPSIPSLLSGNHDFFTTESQGTVMGCDLADLCASASCPSHSGCVSSSTCQCSEAFPKVVGGACVGPCDPTPCRNSGSCDVADPLSSSSFSCHCDSSHSGPLCEVEGCGLGLFRGSSSCQRCLCNPEAVQDGICDASSGSCLCKVRLTSLTLLIPY